MRQKRNRGRANVSFGKWFHSGAQDAERGAETFFLGMGGALPCQALGSHGD